MDLWLIFSIAGPTVTVRVRMPTDEPDKATTTYQSLPPHYMRV